MANDPFLTPLLVNAAVYNTLITFERAQGAVTLKVKGKIHVKDEPTVEIAKWFFFRQRRAECRGSLNSGAGQLPDGRAVISNLDLQNIDLEISAQEDDQAALLDSIRLPRTEVKAGEFLDLEITYKKTNGEMFQDTYPVLIPANASPGPLTMLVADGSTLMSMDEKEEGENLIPRDLTQLIKFINNLRKNDRLYVRLFRQEPGAVVKGEGMPGLPPSILAILKSERKAGAITPIRTSTLMEYEMDATDYMVSGAKALSLWSYRKLRSARIPYIRVRTGALRPKGWQQSMARSVRSGCKSR